MLTLKVTDAAGNSKTLDIILINVEKAPVITVNKYEVNVFGGVAVALTDSQLLLDDEVIAVWTDENLQGCRVALTLNGNAIGAGAVVNEAGKMKLTVTNRYDKSAVAEIVVTNDAIYGLETLRQAQLKVDQEVNLLNGLTFAE